MKRNIVLITFFIIGTLLYTGCKDSNSSTTAPNFTSSNAVYAKEGQRDVITVDANDTTTVIYGISADEDSAKFSIDSFSGNLTFNTVPDYEAPIDSNGDNNYKVTVTATDTSSNQAKQRITVTVTDVEPERNIDITLNGSYHVESLGISGMTNVNVDIGNRPKSLYILLSNYGQSSEFSNISHNKVAVEPQEKVLTTEKSVQQLKVLHAPDYVQKFNNKIKQLLQKQQNKTVQSKVMNVAEKNSDVAGEEKSFCMAINHIENSCSKSTNATAKKIVKISTNYGTKTLNIWVSNDSFDSGSGCSKSKCVTQTMIDQLAATFLKTGTNNDIYDWVTNIYGEEWGSAAEAKYSELISENNEITILFTDIFEDDSPEGGVIGFFWAKDNFTKSSIGGSNERVMFYIDAVMFANGEETWDINDPWPKEIVSTLAHEFQHMIHFYQKAILLADSTADIWINEMLSETTEDIIATKIQHIGPRGVEYTDGSAGDPGNTNGRYPLFNENNTLSLTTWSNQLENYSKVNAFGAYLIRNYGGAKLLHDIVHNRYTDERSVVDAVNKSAEGSEKTFNNLLKEWGIAVMLSDHDNLIDTPFYNTGDFTYSTYSSTTYEMGSINFFNYDPLPTLHTTDGAINAQGNYYYKVGDNLTGNITINLQLTGQVEATLIAK